MSKPNFLAFVLTAAIPIFVFAQSNPPATPSPASTQDLITSSGAIIAQITEAKYWSTPNTLDGYYCRVKNSSNKKITALGLIWDVTFSNDRIDRRYQLMDAKVHEDTQRVQPLKPLAPQGELEFRGAFTESFTGNVSVKNVKVQIDFVEFDDMTSLGSESSKGYKQLTQSREGAVLYKSWLMRIYKDNNQNINAVIEKILSDELPRDTDLHSRHVRQGAIIYRNWLNRLYQQQGVDGIRKVLNN